MHRSLQNCRPIQYNLQVELQQLHSELPTAAFSCLKFLPLLRAQSFVGKENELAEWLPAVSSTTFISVHYKRAFSSAALKFVRSPQSEPSLFNQMACNTLQRSGSFALLTSELPEKRDATTLKRRYYSNLGLDASNSARKEARVASPVRASLPKATVLKLRGARDDDLLQWLWNLFQAVTSPSSAAAGKKRKVRFSEDVTAVAIPSRDEYSYRVKDQAFHSMVEIRDMVTKVSILRAIFSEYCCSIASELSSSRNFDLARGS
jgi:hypothetical protein